LGWNLPPTSKTLEMLKKLESLQPKDFLSLTPEEARKEDLRTSLPFLSAPEPVDRIENKIILEEGRKIPARFYWPRVDEETERDLYPMIAYFHGGGWVVGKLDQYDEICSMLANRSEAIVVSIDYRLAPEHKFPAAVDDCYEATKWVAENAKLFDGDEDTIIVAGDSAGGALTIDVSLLARDRGGPKIAMQVLLCAVTDLTSDMSKYSSDQYGPSKEYMDWFAKQYIAHESDKQNPLASPQLADLRNLPYTILVSAELDTLREQELEFAKKLEQSGVKTKLLDYPGVVHDFLVTPGYFEEGRDALEKIGSEVRRIYVENAE
jgi:acetyl esterase